MTPGCPDRKALLLSGAGARAAYEAGVLKALRELLPESESSPFSSGVLRACSTACAGSGWEPGGAGTGGGEGLWVMERIQSLADRAQRRPGMSLPRLLSPAIREASSPMLTAIRRQSSRAAAQPFGCAGSSTTQVRARRSCRNWRSRSK